MGFFVAVLQNIADYSCCEPFCSDTLLTVVIEPFCSDTLLPVKNHANPRSPFFSFAMYQTESATQMWSEDLYLSQMSVPWNLKGAVLHNVCVAMALSPAFHTDISLLQRCEIALTGFLTLDVFKFLADDTCETFGLPRGSCYMAPQTVSNLQAIALSMVAYCVSKPASFQPFRHGFARMTELAIEQVFGQLRVQSRNAQLSSRGFLQADARLAMRNGKLLNREKQQEQKEEPHLTDDQFLHICIKQFKTFCLKILNDFEAC